MLALGTKFGYSCFRRSEDMIAGVEIENALCDPDHAPFRSRMLSKNLRFVSLHVRKI